MKTLIAALIPLVMAVTISACGSGSSTSSSSAAAAAAPSSTTTASQSASGTVSAASSAAATTTSQLAGQAQRALSKMATATGQLATGNASSENRARTELANARAKAAQVATTADSKLAPSNPARPLIVQATRQGEATAERLETMKITSGQRKMLKSTQTSLSSLAGDMGRLRQQPQQPNLKKIAAGLRNLAGSLGLTGTRTTG